MARTTVSASLGVLLGLAAAVSTAFASGSQETSAASPSAGKVALLLPEAAAERYESADRPDFTAKLTALQPGAQIVYGNAYQDPSLQQSQAEAALAAGIQVLVLDPVDPDAAAAIADGAKAKGIPVIAYDRMVRGSSGLNYYVSYDSFQVGVLQATSLVRQLGFDAGEDAAVPAIVMINGPPTDGRQSLYKQGAHSVFDPLVSGGKLSIAREYDTPEGTSDKALAEMQQALADLDKKVDGVYCADDELAGGAIAALKAAGLDPLPPVTGQGAELAAVQRILKGEQLMTVYLSVRAEAEAAATIAFDLLTKAPVDPSMTNGLTVNNGAMDVPAVLLAPVAVTKDTVRDTVVKDGFWTAAELGLE